MLKSISKCVAQKPQINQHPLEGFGGFLKPQTCCRASTLSIENFAKPSATTLRILNKTSTLSLSLTLSLGTPFPCVLLGLWDMATTILQEYCNDSLLSLSLSSSRPVSSAVPAFAAWLAAVWSCRGSRAFSSRFSGKKQKTFVVSFTLSEDTLLLLGTDRKELLRSDLASRAWSVT
jgi:hypothetical protein